MDPGFHRHGECRVNAWRDGRRFVSSGSWSFMIDLLLMLSAAAAIAGTGAFAIFWPLTLVHLRERHVGLAAQIGPAAYIKPSAIGWLLRGGYRAAGDPSLSGLATPARVSFIAALAGIVLVALLWPLSGGMVA